MKATASPQSLNVSSTTKNLQACPICRSTGPSVVYFFSTFSVLNCGACDSSWRTNLYSSSEIVAMYAGEEYSHNPYFSYDIKDFRTLAPERYNNYQRALSFIESMRGVGKLLDVGCGSGAFLSLAKQRGWEVAGVELSPSLSRACQNNTQVDVVNATFEDAELSVESYDAIAMWDLIEHVINPVFCIQKVKRLLKPGGIVLFCTPDEDSLLARIGLFLYRMSRGKISYPALALHPTYHTYFFSKGGFSEMLTRHKMSVVRCYSQEAFFEHSLLPSRLVKWGIRAIEKLAAIGDRRYEMVCLAQKPL